MSPHARKSRTWAEPYLTLGASPWAWGLRAAEAHLLWISELGLEELQVDTSAPSTADRAHVAMECVKGALVGPMPQAHRDVRTAHKLAMQLMRERLEVCGVGKPQRVHNAGSTPAPWSFPTSADDATRSAVSAVNALERALYSEGSRNG